MVIHKYFLLALGLLPAALLACKTGKPKSGVPAVTYTFQVQVREKYCHAARMDPTLVKETEREKAYASQPLYFIKKGNADTLSATTASTGECSLKLVPGVYGIYFPEKINPKRANNTQRCRDWLTQPDTTVTLDASQTIVPLHLFRGCSPCQPIRQ